MAKLIVKLQDSILKELSLDRPQVTIGRKPDNDLVIDDPAVSSHHARISQVQSVYFIEDLDSTNGTSVNEKRTERKQLKGDDRITIGKHVLIFREDLKMAAPPPLSPRGFDSERTMVLDAKTQRDLLKAGAGGSGRDSAHDQIGTLQVLSGRTDRKEYQLTSRLTVIGSGDNAGVRLTGWFAPKTAAIVSRGKDGYTVSMSEEGKRILVNGNPIETRTALKDGDVVEVVGVKLYFSCKGSGKA